MERLINRHRMKAEDGTPYEVLEYQEYLDASTLDGPAWLPGLKRLCLRDGSNVNFIDENTFRLVWPEVTLKRA